MGLLDDAIREHLELKRRRGADPSEIAREETEALGPVRREAPGEEPLAPAAAGSHTDFEPAAPDEPAVAYDDEPQGDDDEYEDLDDDAPAAVPLSDADRPHLGDPPGDHDRPWAEPEPESATPPHGDPYAHHQPTREFSATELGEALGQHEAPPAEPPAPAPASAHGEAEDDADDAADPEDELDQTPEFLQETPEHDRLWFEQKPPKDFDF